MVVDEGNVAEVLRIDETYAAHFYVAGGAGRFRAGARAFIPRQSGQVNLRFYVTILQKGAYPAHFGTLVGTMVNRVRVGVDGARRLYLFAYDTDYRTTTSSTVLELNHKYCLELQAEVGTETIARVFLDGVEVTDLQTVLTLAEEIEEAVIAGNIGNEEYAGNDVVENYIEDVVVADAYIGPIAPVEHVLRIESTPISVPVTLDGSSVGNTPVDVAVAEGNHTVDVPPEVTG